MKIYFQEEFSLQKFTRTKKDKKLNIERIPHSNKHHLIDVEQFDILIKDEVEDADIIKKEFDTLYSREPDKKVIWTDFNILEVISRDEITNFMGLKISNKELVSIRIYEKKDFDVDELKLSLESVNERNEIMETLYYCFYDEFHYYFIFEMNRKYLHNKRWW